MSLRGAAGSQLRTAIKDSGRSQADVARCAGVSAKHLSQMLHDAAGSFEAFDKIAAELDVVFIIVAWPRREPVPS